MTMERCMICGKESQDLRTLVLRNMYDLSEISLKLSKRPDGFFQVTTCKACRADFMGLLGQWCNSEFVDKDEEPDATVPVRMLGTTRMLTPKQYEDFRRGL